MNVTFNLPIASVSGLISRSRDGRRLIARTSKRTGKTTFHVLDPYQRRTRLTPAERAQRSRFAIIAREVSRLIRLGDTRPRSVIWQDVSATLIAN